MVRASKTHVWLGSVIGGLALSLWGCAADLPPMVEDTQVADGVVVGRALAVITGETSRWYEPEIRFFEFEDLQTHERFNVEMKSDDRYFVVALLSGEYRLNRVQISEGPFMSMAQLAMDFSVRNSPVTYLGTWRFGVDSPRYGRMVVVSMILDQGETEQALEFLTKRYPSIGKPTMVEMLPQPSQMEARLYEVMPYPRYKYFRRHHW